MYFQYNAKLVLLDFGEINTVYSITCYRWNYWSVQEVLDLSTDWSSPLGDIVDGGTATIHSNAYSGSKCNHLLIIDFVNCPYLTLIQLIYIS